MQNMKRPPSELTWSVREVVDVGTRVGAIACNGGRVLFGGDMVYRLVPGRWEVQHRGVPDEVGTIQAIAIEPRTPHRVAIGPETGDVVVFTDTADATTTIGHTFGERRGAKAALSLAWVLNDEQSSLFARTDDGALYRMQAEGWDELELPPAKATAQDEYGSFAALFVVDGQAKVFLTFDGGTSWHLRLLGTVETEPDAPAHLAVFGVAVAAAVGDSGALVSFGPEEPTTRPKGLERARSLAFARSDGGAWLYAALARTAESPAAVALMDDEGHVLQVMKFVADDDKPLELGPIAWDTGRKALMIVSRSGLMALSPERPKRAGAKKAAARKAAKKPAARKAAKKPAVAKKAAKKAGQKAPARTPAKAPARKAAKPKRPVKKATTTH